MPPNFSLRKNLSLFFVSRQKITGFIIFYCFPVLLAPPLSNYRHIDLIFWCIPLGQTQNLLELVFLFFQEEAFASLNFLPKVHDQDINFRRISGLPIFFSQKKSSCCVVFLLGRTSPSPSLSKQPPLPTKFCIFSYDIGYSQSIHRNFVFFTFMGTFMPL